MGLLDKIEAKLTGHSASDGTESTVLHKEPSASSSLQHPIQSAGQASTMPLGQSSTSGQPGTGQAISSGGSSSTTAHGSEATPYKTQAAIPYDPYTSRGQNTAAAVIPDGVSNADEFNVPRSRTGGITNSPENHDAIPTAGGVKIGKLDANNLEHHFVRNAAIGGIGGSGVAAYGLEKHSHDRSARDEYGQQDHTQHHHHLGHDAAVAGGLGTAGVGAYEAEQHRHSNNPASLDNAQQHHCGRDTAIAGGVGATGVGAYEAEKYHHQRQAGSDLADAQDKHHHLGRDAAIVGGAGVGLHELEKHHHLRQDEQGQGSHLLHRDRDNDAFSRNDQPHQPHQHHLGRDTAIAGAAGATGVGAHELEKHHHHRQEVEGPGYQGQSSSAPRYRNDLSDLAQGIGTKDVSFRNNPLPGLQFGTSAQRAGEYVAAGGVGAAGVSAVGLAEHEHHKHDAQSSHHLGLFGAKKMATAYESGYQAGWHDALEHVKSQTRS